MLNKLCELTVNKLARTLKGEFEMEILEISAIKGILTYNYGIIKKINYIIIINLSIN